MVDILKQVLNMSLTASIIILFVMAARLLLRKAPKIYSYALWAVVLFRLLCPVSLSLDLSVLEVASPQVTQTEGISTVTYVPFAAEAKESGEVLTPETPQTIYQAEKQLEQGSAPNPLPWKLAALAWLAGIAVMGLYSAVTYYDLHRRLIGALHWKENIYLADNIPSPFVLGIFRPKIYLPSDTPMEERRYIIAHERHHIRRGDHILKLLAYGALCIHWFNPLVWAAFILAGKDMEMSCDEAVIKKLGPHIRADYSASLLRLATHKSIISGTPLAFGEGDTKGRVKNMAKWKKPKVWVSILCVVLCVGILIVCAANPKENVKMGGGIEFRGLTLRLPEGYFHNHDGKNFTFIDGDTAEIVGGFMICEAPEVALEKEAGEDGVWNAEEWLSALGIPEDEALVSHVISDDPSVDIEGYPLYGDLVAAYTTVPEDIEEKLYYFYVEEETVKIVWFDRRKIEQENILAIMDTVEITADAESKPVEIIKQNGPTTAGFGELYFTLPAGYTMESVPADAGDYDYMMQISNGTDIIGGVVHYDAPDLELIGLEDTKDMALWNFDAWIRALGIPDTMDETLGYMSGGSLYADYQIEYFTDLPEPVENPVQRQHYLFLWEEAVYDLWFDETVVGYKTIETIMKTAAVGQDGPLVVEATPTETEGLEKCRAVLELVQSGSLHIFLEQRCGGNAGPGDYTQEYLRHEDNWLSIITVQIGETTDRHANLYVNGRYFDNMGKWSEEEILWTESKRESRPLRPWLTTFQWQGNNVTYVDTLTSDGDTVIMLRIDEPYPGYEDVTECYWVDFRFDSSGSFIQAEIEMDYISSDDQVSSIDTTESIVTLDATTVAAQIEKEYFRATGESLQGNTVVTDLELYQESFVSNDGTVTVNINTAFVPERLEVEGGLSMAGILAAVEADLRTTSVDSFGFDPAAMGHVGTTCELNITEIRVGDSYLLSATESVPTLEVWGERIYHFANGDELGQEHGAMRLLGINPQNGMILYSSGRKLEPYIP